MGRCTGDKVAHLTDPTAYPCWVCGRVAEASEADGATKDVQAAVVAVGGLHRARSEPI